MPVPPNDRPERGRLIFRWLLTVIVGIAGVAVVLNRTGIIGQRANLGAQATFSAQASSAFVNSLATQILAGMTLDEKVGQLIIPMASDYNMNSDMQTLITQDHIGGFFVTSGGMNATQVRSFINQMQGASKIPMIMSADFEGDQGFDVLASALPAQPSEAQVGATGDPHQAYLKGINDGKALASIGINVDFGPVVDVLTNPNNPILQGRTYGNTANYVTQMAGQELDGLAAEGIAGTVKHFPGLGSSTIDPHKALPLITRTLAQMESVELVPYKQLIAEGKVNLIMTTHMLIPALDPNLPTSISPYVLTTLLRQQMGYDGVVVSDALFMGGLAYKWDIPHAGLLAFEAGTDLLLGAGNAAQTRETMDLIEGALARKEISQQQIDTSVLRILKLKVRWHIIPANFQPSTGATGFVQQNAPVTAFVLDTRRRLIG
jgi:beta-N-acetylhexosaminidase